MMPILLIIQALQPLRFNIFSKIPPRHSLVSLGARPHSSRCAERKRQGEGRWSRPPKAALEPSHIRPRIPVPRIAYLSREKKLLTKVHDTKEWLYIQGMVLYIYLFQFRESHTEAERKNSWPKSMTPRNDSVFKEWSYIYLWSIILLGSSLKELFTSPKNWFRCWKIMQHRNE